MQKGSTNKCSGFTLVELLVTVGIIGVLAAIAIPQFAEYRGRAFDASAIEDLKNSTESQEAYFIEHDTYVSCATAAACEAILPGFAPNKIGSQYAIVPFEHTAAGNGLSYTATAKHSKGSRTHNYDSTTGHFTES